MARGIMALHPALSTCFLLLLTNNLEYPGVQGRIHHIDPSVESVSSALDDVENLLGRNRPFVYEKYFTKNAFFMRPGYPLFKGKGEIDFYVQTRLQADIAVMNMRNRKLSRMGDIVIHTSHLEEDRDDGSVKLIGRDVSIWLKEQGASIWKQKCVLWNR